MKIQARKDIARIMKASFESGSIWQESCSPGSVRPRSVWILVGWLGTPRQERPRDLLNLFQRERLVPDLGAEHAEIVDGLVVQ
jgi:hypothetical protein